MNKLEKCIQILEQEISLINSELSGMSRHTNSNHLMTAYDVRICKLINKKENLIKGVSTLKAS